MISVNPPLLAEAAPNEIMAIDGSTTLLKVYERVFTTTRELKAYRLVNFTSGRIALDWLDRNPGRRPQAILLERAMEGFSGMDMLQKLKGESRWKHIPVIMASTMGEPAHVVEAIRGGASDYIIKPLQSGVLAGKVLKVLAKQN